MLLKENLAKSEKILLTLTILLISIGFFYWAYTEKEDKTKLSNEIDLSVRYPGGYETEQRKVGDIWVGYALNRKGITSTQFFPSTNSVPIVFAYHEDYKQIYEISCGDKSNYIWLRNIEYTDLDLDGQNEFITEWVRDTTTDSGPRGLVIWQLDKQEGLVPIAGLPEDIDVIDDHYMTISEVGTGRTYQFSSNRADFYVEYAHKTFWEVETPFQMEIAEYIWELSGECHQCPHKWRLHKFIFQDNRFIRDPDWNDGEAYLTEKKYEIYEAGLSEVGKLFNQID